MAAFYFANFSQKLTAYIIRRVGVSNGVVASAKIRQALLGCVIFNRQRHFI